MNHILLVGNLGRDPELAYSAQGLAVCKFTLATKERMTNGEDTTTWHNITCFGATAENVAGSIQKGDRVIVVGNARKSKYEKKDGTTGYSDEVRAYEIGVDLRFGIASLMRTGGSQSQDRKPSGTDAEEPF